MNKTIKDISLEIGSGITPLRSNELYWNSPDIPWIKTEQLGQYKIFDSTEYISNFALEDTNIRLWSPHTVSVAMYGEGKTRGNASILMIETATNQACCNIKVNDALADYRFLYYWLKNNYENLRTLSAGVRKNLNADDIKNFPFPENSLHEQEKIADILSVVDDKIELNSKICSELESMAKTLYDYWFVQFDFPDENGKPYRTSGGEMEWNEQLKREIPKGWSVKPIIDEFDVCYGYPFDTTKFTEDEDGIPIIRIRDILENTTSAKTLEIVDEKYKVNRGDLIVGMDGNFHMNFWSGHPALLNQRCFKISSLGYSVLIAYFSAKPYIKAREKNVTRTTVGHLSADDVQGLFVLVPTEPEKQKFSAIFDDILNKICQTRSENEELTKLRDWLLPMLMNGQARVE